MNQPPPVSHKNQCINGVFFNNNQNDNEEYDLELKRKTNSSKTISSNYNETTSATIGKYSSSTSSSRSNYGDNNCSTNEKSNPIQKPLNTHLKNHPCLYHPGAYTSQSIVHYYSNKHIAQINGQHYAGPGLDCNNNTSIGGSKQSNSNKLSNKLIYHESLARKMSYPKHKCQSLLEITAKYVAGYFPYEYIEQKFVNIPEPVQKLIIFWSFPRDERYIRLYSSISSIFKQDFNITANTASYHLYSGPSPLNFSTQTANNDHDWESQSTFNKGLHLFCYGTVHQVLQIGFNLTGIVMDIQFKNKTNIIPCFRLINKWIQPISTECSAFLQNNDNGNNWSEHNSLIYRKNSINGFLVSITFDRCKITSATCTCTPTVVHLFWCEHVVALALFRIYKPYQMNLRIPISETLLDLDRKQLQKLVQYLIAEHHVQILPTVQRLTDELIKKDSVINSICGAPDPTAGACIYSQHDWYLNEERTAAQIRDLVKYVTITESNKIILLFYKVIEMLKMKDSNGSRFLRIITDQFVYGYSPLSKVADLVVDRINDPYYIFLWDHLINLWIFIVADPSILPNKREEFRDMFIHWSHIENSPIEDTFFSLKIEPFYKESILYNNHYLSKNSPKRRIFERAREATFLTWDNAHLQLILKNNGPFKQMADQSRYDMDGFPIWKEHLPTACVRVASLRVNGRAQEALRLAMAIVRFFKHEQNSNYPHTFLMDVVPSTEAWIGCPLDPIGILFDTLAEASLTPDSKSFDAYYALVGFDKRIDNSIFSRNALVDVFAKYSETNTLLETDLTTNIDTETNDKPKYQHVLVPGAIYHSDTYLNSALYIALVGLSQFRCSPNNVGQRDRTFRQEERIIRKLLDIKLDAILISTLQMHALHLINNGLLSDFVTGPNKNPHIPNDIIQIPGLVRYMFGALLSTDSELAYNIGLRSLRFFSFKDDRQAEHDQLSRSKFSLYLDVQSLLARTMLFAARDEYRQLQKIFDTIKTYVIDPHYLNKLAQDIFNFSSNGSRQEQHLLKIAYQFGLHLTKITLNEHLSDSCRKNTINWLVTCATQIGTENVLYLMRNWKDYFTPSEAVRYVVTSVLAPNFNTSSLVSNIAEFENLAITARKLAVECAMKDPSSCALNALSLCEKDQYAFNTISKVVETSGSLNQINSYKLFTIARYLEHQGAFRRACKIALLAANQVIIPLSADTHNAINDLQWACNLAQSLGTEELSELIDILIKNVRCASVLSDMIRRCSIPHTIIPKHVILQNGIRSNCVNEPTNNLFIEHLTIDDRMRCRHYKSYPLDRPPLSKLVYAAIKAYFEAVMRRLEHISPRHYSDFIEFLTRAQETIILAPDGKMEFSNLLDNIKTMYKGKKKLMCLVKERFG